MRGAGLPVEVLIEYVRLYIENGDDETLKARKELLIEQRTQLVARMEEMQKVLERLNYKISIFDQKLLEAEKTLKKPKKSFCS
jgi:DNA-binding transcriptional MerR regulator